jgi:hypothetical protein
MGGVAVNTDRDIRVTLCEELTVSGRVIDLYLVDPDVRIIPVHELLVGVASAAQLGDEIA